MDHMKDDELKRVGILETALSQYISGTKSRHQMSTTMNMTANTTMGAHLGSPVASPRPSTAY